MAMRADRSKALHNFTLPGGLRWGNQRHLRCIKVESDAQVSPPNRFTANDSDSFDHHYHDRSSQRRHTSRDGRGDSVSSELVLLGSSKTGSTPDVFLGSSSDKDDGVAAVRERVMFDLQKAADKIKGAIFKEGRSEGVVVSASASPPLLPQPAAVPVEGESNWPWNLRTRRAACKTPAAGSGFVSDVTDGALAAGGKGLMVDGSSGSGISPPRGAAVIDKPSRLRSGGGVSAPSGEKRERAKFSIALSKEEIEEDFLAFVNHRPPRRPRKRAKNVQKQLDLMFPGLWLTEITPDMYKVCETDR